MQRRYRLLPRLTWFLSCWMLIPALSWSQIPSPQSRIVQSVNESVLVTLRGNTHPLAQPQFDRGAAPPDLPMARMLLVLQRSAAQESALQKLLDDQQDRNSPSYHQWLTPDVFGQQFGPSDQDIQTITTWLQSHGFQVARVGRGRTSIEFSGTALQVQQAFHTDIHKYAVNGEEHWANAGDPQIPAALSPVVAGVVSLHNFPKQPMHRVAGVFSRSRATGQVQAQNPDFTLPNSYYCQISNYCYLVGPYDFATIYNVQPLWSGSPAIDGTGQSIAIVAVSNINLQDVRDFRTLFGLPANDPQIILDGPDPGLVSEDETEADLDVEWSGAVAPGATIKLVVSASTNSSDGVDLSALYVVENNVAPVMSESFGECELYLGTSGNSFENAIREQAAAEGITFINSSGDEGSARCDTYSGNTPDPATHGLTVSGLASSPHGVAVGGTDFANFGSNITLRVASPYWSLNNDPHQASVLGYVPETTWNSSCTNGAYVTLGAGSTAEAACNNSQLTGAVVSVGGGGGKSNCITSDGANGSSCTGGYAKPSWQSAPGVPLDNARDIPDVSLFASSGFMDSAYIVCEADQVPGAPSCSLSGLYSTFLGVGGTSASAPAFAGMMALVNQFTQSTGQGNANYVLYKLASLQSQRALNCNASGTPASGCIFNDVTAGTIAMPCKNGSPNCTVSNGADTYGVLSGYNAGAGYDLATGLGSVNAYNLVHGWSQATFTPTTTTLVLNNGNPVSITHGQSLPLKVAVTPTAATGDVSLVGSPGGSGSVPMGTLTLQNGVASGTTATLQGGNSYAVKAHYAGDGIYAPSDSSPVIVTVAPESSKTLISIPVFDLTGKETGNTPSSLVYGSPYIARMDVGNANAAVTFPPKSLCAPLTCPTGSVTLMDSLNSGPQTAVGTGVFSLNADGGAEYDSIQLSGGSHQLSASYAGDNSYIPSTGTYNLTVTPAPTQVSTPNIGGTLVAGVQEFFEVIVTANAVHGVAPTGTITFYDGTTPISGNVTLSGQPGGVGVYASLVGSITTEFVTSGTHQITAQYSGDANYAAATSPAAIISVLYPTTASLTSTSVLINLGDTVTITATVTSPTKSPLMTGTFQFSASTPIPSPVTPALSFDANGNQVLSAIFATMPQNFEGIQLTYSGDANFQRSTAYVSIEVIIPDFSITTGTQNLTINAGQSGTDSVLVTPLSDKTSTVALSCPQPQYQISGVSCTFTPSSPLSLSNSAPASILLSVISIGPSGSTITTRLVAVRRLKKRQIPMPGWWVFGIVNGLALLLLTLSSEEKRHRLTAKLSMICLLSLILGCGAGNSAGGGGSGGSTVPSLVLSVSAVKVPAGGSVTLTATVSPAGLGRVTFVDTATNGFPGFVVPVVNGIATATLSNQPVGTHVIGAQYSSDGINITSKTSSSINVVFTGTTQLNIQGSTSGLSHTTSLNLTIQ